LKRRKQFTATTLNSLQKSKGNIGVRCLLNEDFASRWNAIAYLEPGLHPDGYDCEDSGWPEDLKPYATEACRRFGLGELKDEALYCSYAGWAGLYDLMNSHTEEEVKLRERIARGEF
jgi:hypothetical protein